MEHVKWKESDVIYYSSRKYLNQSEHCKLYKIDHTWGSIQNHIHDYFQIWFVKKGEFKHAIDNQPLYRMVKGNIFLIPPYTMHRVEIEEDGIFEIIGCEFMPEVIERHSEAESGHNSNILPYLKPFWMEVKQLKPKISLIGKSDKWAETMLEEMFTEYAAKPPFYNVFLKGCLLQLLTFIIRKEYQQNNRDEEIDHRFAKHERTIERIMEHIESNYHKDIGLEDAIKLSMMSKTSFCSAFKQVSGSTFNQFLTDIRIKKSTELLLNTNMTITEICFEVGFNDMAYFSRIFKKAVGVPPTTFQKFAANIVTPHVT